MENLVSLLSAFIANPTALVAFILFVLIVVGLPHYIHFVTMSKVVERIEASIDNLDAKVDKFISFLLDNVKVKKKDDD